MIDSFTGDPMQLGPVVCSKYATEFGLYESFMERLLSRFPYIRDLESFPKTGGYDPRLVTKLVYNYRSLPGVLELPNSLFYFSELKPTVCRIYFNCETNLIIIFWFSFPLMIVISPTCCSSSKNFFLKQRPIIHRRLFFMVSTERTTKYEILRHGIIRTKLARYFIM